MNKITQDLRAAAAATCSNAYLMDSGKIITMHEYKALPFVGKLSVTMYYDYHNNRIVKI